MVRRDGLLLAMRFFSQELGRKVSEPSRIKVHVLDSNRESLRLFYKLSSDPASDTSRDTNNSYLSTLLMISFSEYYETFKNIMEKYARTDTRIARFWIGTELACNIDDPKLLEVILTNQKFLSKSSQYNFMSESLGVGLLLSTNQTWFNRRRAITPTFHFKILEQFFEIFIKQNKILLGKISDIADGRIFDIFPMITASVMNALCGKFIVLLDEFITELIKFQKPPWAAS